MQTEIKQVAIEVQIWRRQTGSKVKGMPESLQKRVVKLLEEYSWSDVCKTVGIGRSSLFALRKRYCGELQLKPRPQSKRPPRAKAAGTKCKPAPQPAFIEVTGPMAITSARLQVELRLPSGLVVRAESQTDVDAVERFANKIIANVQATL